MLIFIVAIILLVVMGGTLLISYTKSKGEYDEYVETLDKKEYGLKDFIPIGIYLYEKSLLQRFLPKKIYKYVHKQSNKTLAKIVEIYGPQYSQFYFLIHNANKIAISLLIATGGLLLAVITGGQGDLSTCKIFMIFGIGLAGLMFYIIDKGLEDKIQKRRFEIQMEFPDFVNKLMLLVNAGMTISKAWEKIVNDNQKDSTLYNEMRYAVAEIKVGKSEAAAYEEFARRCKIKEIIKFVSVIILNLKKGGTEVVPTLRVQATECWEMRKAAAKRLGEEASTKILIPLMIMFVGILIIVATPAVLSFSGGM